LPLARPSADEIGKQSETRATRTKAFPMIL
jgi:hypothetical protein